MTPWLLLIALYLLGMPIAYFMPDTSPAAVLRLERLVWAVLWPIFGLYAFWIIISETLQSHPPLNPRHYENEDRE